jgi:predicted SnoaL-like aldol condensation-catalyzing enzyme
LVITIIKAKSENQLGNQNMDRFFTIFNDKRILIPSKIKEKQKIQNGDLIMVTIEKVYSSEDVKAKVKKMMVIPF